MSERRFFVVMMVLIVTTFAVYWPVRNHEFINFDDNVYLTSNPIVKRGLTFKNITWALAARHASNWHPLTWISHMLDVELYGLDPGRHHMTSVLFHILSALMLFILLKRMTGSVWRSGFVAALFALHPLQVESVAWVAQRKTVLSTFLGMLTLWSYVRYVEEPGGPRYLATLLFFMLGLLSKPMLVTLPFVMLLLDYWPLDRFRPGIMKNRNNARQWGIKTWLFLEKTPFFVLAAASSTVTYLVQREGGAVSSLDMISLKLRVSNTLVSYIAYIIKMFWPQRLAVFYPYPSNIPMWKVVGASMLLAVISLGVIVSMKRRPYLLVGWLWYIGTLVPVIGLVQVGAQALADRYAYVTLIGLFIMIAWGVPVFWGKINLPRIGLHLIAAISLLLLLTGSWLQNRYWRNSIELFSHTLTMTSNNFVAHNDLGSALAQKGKTTEAITQFSEALRIKPRYAKAHNNLGSALEKQGRIKEAIEHYLKALQIRPEYAKAYHNLGNAYVKQGRTQEAIKHYLKALRIKPALSKTHINLGNALNRQGRTEEAIGHYLVALRIRPDSAKAHNNLGNALVELGRIEEAIKHYLEALRIRPGLVTAHKNLGVALFRNGNIEGAIDHYQRALRIRPGDTVIKNNLNQLLMIMQQRK